MIVVDASVVLELLLRTERALDVEFRLFDMEETLHAPHLLDLEVAQVLRRYSLSGELTDERAHQAFEDLASVSIRRYSHDLFLPRIWELRHDVTAYDAVYLSLAESLPATLLTCDLGLRDVPGASARVETL